MNTSSLLHQLLLTFQLHADFIAVSLLITLKSHGILWKNTLPLIFWRIINSDNHSNNSDNHSNNTFYTSCSSNWNHWFSLTVPDPILYFDLLQAVRELLFSLIYSSAEGFWKDAIPRKCWKKTSEDIAADLFWFLLFRGEKKWSLDVRLIEKVPSPKQTKTKEQQQSETNTKKNNTKSKLHWILNSQNIF